jgi:hypothetical protein
VLADLPFGSTERKADRDRYEGSPQSISEKQKTALIEAMSISSIFSGAYIFDDEFYHWIEEELKDRRPLIKVLTLIEPSESMGLIFWHCPDCKEKYDVPASKTKILDWVKSNIRQCLGCKKTSDRRKKEEMNRRFRPLTEEEVDSIADSYCEHYLNTERAWSDKTKQYERISAIRRGISNSRVEEIVIERIKEMDYRDFLCTPYWKAVATEVRKKAGFKCSICNSSGQLHVHHRTYDNHGREHTYDGIKDLVCICADCHENYHFK